MGQRRDPAAIAAADDPCLEIAIGDALADGFNASQCPVDPQQHQAEQGRRQQGATEPDLLQQRHADRGTNNSRSDRSDHARKAGCRIKERR
ncbi:hypothetical protein [Rhodopseudomonas palustris]|uniref:hypothetical protein n=1 Tax=Rhodopseudomonas palustris TaxID=1076 RepID=UPI001F3D4E52|nr:hypothetical protein [Rhodopseudomonas palustris]